MAIIWIGLTFWLALAIDYLPVLVGSSEMPRTVRIVVLAAIGTVLAWILYHYVLQRAFARLRDRSMAVLLERTFPQFKDSLLTTVELADGESPQVANAAPVAETRAMLDQTTAMANASLSSVDLGKVFRKGPLVRRMMVAALLVASIVGMAVFAQEAFAVWASRLYMLSNQTWPRRAEIEVVGFNNGSLKVAKGKRSDHPSACEHQKNRTASLHDHLSHRGWRAWPSEHEPRRRTA